MTYPHLTNTSETFNVWNTIMSYGSQKYLGWCHSCEYCACVVIVSTEHNSQRRCTLDFDVG